MLSLLLFLLVFGVVIWGARKLLAAFAIEEPLNSIIYVIIVVVAVWWLVGHLHGINF